MWVRFMNENFLQKMLDESRLNSEELISEGLYSSKSSMSSDCTTINHCTSFSRLWFELPTSSSEQQAALKCHRSSDSSFQAIRLNSNLNFWDFSLVRQIGSGDIGSVYLSHLRGSADEGRLYAMKVVDNEVLAMKKKMQRAETERKIMRLLDKGEDEGKRVILYKFYQHQPYSPRVCGTGDLEDVQ